VRSSRTATSDRPPRTQCSHAVLGHPKMSFKQLPVAPAVIAMTQASLKSIKADLNAVMDKLCEVTGVKKNKDMDTKDGLRRAPGRVVERIEQLKAETKCTNLKLEAQNESHTATISNKEELIRLWKGSYRPPRNQAVRKIPRFEA
jgi:hypothetical protein